MTVDVFCFLFSVKTQNASVLVHDAVCSRTSAKSLKNLQKVKVKNTLIWARSTILWLIPRWKSCWPSVCLVPRKSNTMWIKSMSETNAAQVWTRSVMWALWGCVTGLLWVFAVKQHKLPKCFYGSRTFRVQLSHSGVPVFLFWGFSYLAYIMLIYLYLQVFSTNSLKYLELLEIHCSLWNLLQHTGLFMRRRCVYVMHQLANL